MKPTPGVDRDYDQAMITKTSALNDYRRRNRTVAAVPVIHADGLTARTRARERARLRAETAASNEAPS
jgi:hypothetical protein